MRVLQIWHCLGGVHTHVTTIIAALRSRGAEVYCISEPRFLESPVLRIAKQAVIWDFESFTTERLTNFLSWCSEFIVRQRIDVVHLHGIRPTLAGSLAAAMAGVPYVITWHGLVDGLGLLQRLGRALSLVFTRITLPGAAKVLTVKPPLADSLHQAFRLPRNKVAVFWNPVDCAELDMPVPNEVRKPVATLVSQLIQSKERAILGAMRFFAELARKWPVWDLRVAGDGKLLENLRSTAKALCIPLQFLGFRHDVSELVRESNLLVGMGRVIIEAAAARRLAVIAAYDGTLRLLTPDLFRYAQLNNFNGEGLPAHPPASLAADVNRAVRTGDFPVDRLRSMVLRDHDAAAAAERLMSLYQQAGTHRYALGFCRTVTDVARHLNEFAAQPPMVPRILSDVNNGSEVVAVSPAEEVLLTRVERRGGSTFGTLPRARQLVRAGTRFVRTVAHRASLLGHPNSHEVGPRRELGRREDLA